MQITIVYQTTLPTVKDLNFSAINQICNFSLYKPENYAYLKRAENHNKTKKNHAYNESRKSRLFKKHRKSGQKVRKSELTKINVLRSLDPSGLDRSTLVQFWTFWIFLGTCIFCETTAEHRSMRDNNSFAYFSFPLLLGCDVLLCCCSLKH